MSPYIKKRLHPFKKGDKVIYTGTETRRLYNQTGVVTETRSRESIVPVKWKEYGYYGAYFYNLELVDFTWDWEV